MEDSIEAIDYQAIAERLQRELEQARLTIVKLRHAHSPLDRVSAEGIRQFVQRNYLVIMVSIMLLSFIVSFLKTFKGLTAKSSKE